ncbi:hypothetical protein J5069_04265 [Candidatus Symbiopectobacterium sp. NZEC127]|uniref:hypothetical protein n=1 Tax=Candidatus Symbiopectobacterium sp. NZEC127 TaxID=2820472 RepID=UPI002226C1D9|nr:hypothetical protein [Candidatus Symbiopectobacterium sp. NZEC127]MCW2485108.1 hypothetical protein [Candidatus Symbiopectobacterium sp. NZEC127]
MKKFGVLIFTLTLNICVPTSAQGTLSTTPPRMDNIENVLALSGRAGVIPANRLVVYYGNFNSRRMGILGEYPAPELWKRLTAEAQEWEKADPSKPVIPGLEYIATVASNQPGRDGLYRNRMSDKQIDIALSVVRMTPGAVLILDVQPGRSDLHREISRLELFLIQPDVHLGIDPEFIMMGKSIPGARIGTINDKDINRVVDYLSALVVKNNLPPKVLVVHRFTKKMVTGFDKIKSDPNVQVILSMDGWGAPETKVSTYEKVVSAEKGVLYPGIKIFYKNDIRKPPHRLLSKAEVLGLQPQPVYIQYQ